MKRLFIIVGIAACLIHSANGQDVRYAMLYDQNVLDGLQEYLRQIPVGHEEYFGFSDRSQFNEVSFGRPLQIHHIAFDSLATEGEIRPTSSWYIPIIVRSEYRCILQIRKNAEEYKVIGIGYTNIASDLNKHDGGISLSKDNAEGIIDDCFLNILCLISKDDTYLPLRSLSSCSSCDKNEDDIISRDVFLERIKSKITKSNNYYER